MDDIVRDYGFTEESLLEFIKDNSSEKSKLTPLKIQKTNGDMTIYHEPIYGYVGEGLVPEVGYQFFINLRSRYYFQTSVVRKVSIDENQIKIITNNSEYTITKL